MTTRINARLDDELAAEVERLRKQTGMTLTEVVEAALTAWTKTIGRSRRGPAEVFRKAGFIGSGKGPRHLARDYKKELFGSLEKKT